MPFDRFSFDNRFAFVGAETARTKIHQSSFYTAFKLSLNIDRLLFGSARPKIAAGFIVLGRAYLEQGRRVEAGKYFQRALQISEKLRPNRDDLKAQALANLGRLRYEEGRF